MLTPQQRRRYATDGYLVLPELIPPAALRAARAAALRIVDDFDLAAHHTVFTTGDRDAGRDEAFFASAQRVHCFLEQDALDHDGGLRRPPRLAINKIGHAMHDLVPELGALCRRPELGAALRELGVTDPRVWQTMYIFKQPRIGGEVRWHQDASYLITRPASVMGVWIAIEDAHQGNGCLRVQPGGHRSPLREIYEVDWERREGTLRTLDPAPWPTAADAVALEVPAGSVVLFHDHLPHASEPNRSERSRHAFTMHVAPRDVSWSSRNWLQRPQLGDFAL